MARRTRHSLPGAIYHVMMRGNNGQAIFSSDEERHRFCLLMQEGVERFRHNVLAFCFMDNHVHLAIQLGDIPMSKICQNLAFRYTSFYHRKHDTYGHLFQGRFRSILVDGIGYLKRLIRYIHLNPVRAGITDDPIHYPWSSHRAYLMHQEFTWLSRDIGLYFFGGTQEESIEAYRHFIIAGIGHEESIDFKKGITDGVIGEDRFIEKVLEKPAILYGNTLPKIKLETFLSSVAECFEIDTSALASLGNDRKASRIRAVTAHLVREFGGISLKEVAEFCGRADNSMSQAATRLQAQLKKSESLKEEIEFIKSKMVLASKLEL